MPRVHETHALIGITKAIGEKMDKKQLKQYRALLRERQHLEEKIEKLYRRIDQLPDVIDKVQASAAEYPYIEIHVPVKAKPPREMTELKRLIRINERREREVIKALVRIEEYIKSIPDSEDRQIFEMVFLDGMTYMEVGEALNMDLSTAAKRIDRQLSKNSKK